MQTVTTRWSGSDVPRGDDYDARWAAMAARGESVHGEADLVEALLTQHGLRHRVLDAGCGTGRVAIELARRGFDVVGLDADDAMLATARAKAPSIAWIGADLAEAVVLVDGPCGLTVLAGNVMIFLAAGTESRVVGNVAATVEPGGLVVAGFQVLPGRVALADYDAWCAAADLELVDRWATWQCAPYEGGDYAVSVHRRR